MRLYIEQSNANFQVFLMKLMQKVENRGKTALIGSIVTVVLVFITNTSV